VTAYLSTEDLLTITKAAVGPHAAVRDVGLLASAAARPEASAFGADAYRTLAGKAAALMHSVCGNHALIDGNKRLAWLATYTFLALNGTQLDVPDDDAVALVLAVADGTLDYDGLHSALILMIGSSDG
jgi:death-on-curing protein